MAEAPKCKIISNVKKDQSRGGAVNVTVNIHYLKMAGRPKYIVVNT
jgi:hypothetical protein